MLDFVNVDFIYSTTNNNDSHFILEGIVKKIKLKDTGFPQLASSDIIKHKVLMEYGTPKEFDGVWHIYQDVNSTYKVRELDERNPKSRTKSLKVVDKLEKAIDDTYSKQGIEYKTFNGARNRHINLIYFIRSLKKGLTAFFCFLYLILS